MYNMAMLVGKADISVDILMNSFKYIVDVFSIPCKYFAIFLDLPSDFIQFLKQLSEGEE